MTAECDIQNLAGETRTYNPKMSFLVGAFAKLRKSDYYLHHVCPSVRIEQLCFHWADFHEILYFNIFRKPVEKIQVSLKSGKNKGYFIKRQIHISGHVSLNSS
jgi:hypothetical protein